MDRFKQFVQDNIANADLATLIEWKRELNDKWVANYTYYATVVKFSFETDSGVDLRADIADRMAVTGGGSIEWKTKGSFIITNTDDVPFGFSGWKL